MKFFLLIALQLTMTQETYFLRTVPKNSDKIRHITTLNTTTFWYLTICSTDQRNGHGHHRFTTHYWWICSWEPWKRSHSENSKAWFLDDICMIWQGDKEELRSFFDHLNRQWSSINFTYEADKNFKILLDLGYTKSKYSKREEYWTPNHTKYN